MKNFKRILALVIAIVMVVGTFASLSAAGSKWYSEAVTFIEENGIAVIGANADKKITRNEFVLWVAKIESHQLSDTAWSEQIANTVFTDVTDAHYKARSRILQDVISSSATVTERSAPIRLRPLLRLAP